MHFLAIVDEFGQLLLKFGGKFESLMISFNLVEEFVFLAGTAKLNQKHLLGSNRLMVELLVGHIVPDLLTRCSFPISNRKDGIHDHVDGFVLHDLLIYWLDYNIA